MLSTVPTRQPLPCASRFPVTARLTRALVPAASALMRTLSPTRRHDCRRGGQTACATSGRHGLLDLGEYVWSLRNDGHGRAAAEALRKGCQRRFGCAVSKWAEARRQLRREPGNVEMNLKTPSGQC